jgi:putative hemolysin
MQKLTVLALALILTAAVAAPARAQLIGMANPASTLCLSTGGQLVISDGAGGQSGTCAFDNGLAIDEWSLYHLLSAWIGF